MGGKPAAGRRAFRAQVSAAPLKRRQAGRWTVLQAGLPRSGERGPVEAQLRAYEANCEIEHPFRAQVSAAPLKRRRQDIAALRAAPSALR